MKKYLVLSFCIHALLFMSFFHYQRAGKENIKMNQVISVSFVAENVKPSENPGSPNLAEKMLEKQENSINERQKEEVKQEKPKKKEKVKEKSFESKIASKDAKVKEQEEYSPPEDATETGKEESSKEEEKGASNPFYGSNFQANGDGSYTALSSEGILYEILNEVAPEYPSQAESISYEQRAIVKVKFLVGLQGNVEDIQIVQSYKKLGFDDEVRKAIKKWKFKPIYYAGKNIKVYFIKEFIFNPR